MEIFAVLALLTIMTFLVIGWWYGSLFCCVFLTLIGIGTCVIINAAGAREDVVFFCLFVTGFAWAPRLMRRPLPH